MLILKIWKQIQQSLPKRLFCRPSKIVSSTIFQNLVNREQAVANRNRHSFSLIVFNIKKCNSASLIEITTELKKRIRFTDVLGWYDSEHIGILLPYTEKSEAEKVRENLCRQFEKILPDLKSKIFLCTSQKTSNQYKRNNQSRRNKNSGLRNPKRVSYK